MNLLDNEQPSGRTSYVGELLDKMEKILHAHRQNDPHLYRLIKEKKRIDAAKK